jgi:hypothetical protein
VHRECLLIFSIFFSRLPPSATVLQQCKHRVVNTRKHTRQRASDVSLFLQPCSLFAPASRSRLRRSGVFFFFYNIVRARKVGGNEREFIGPCSLLMVERAHTQTHALRTHAQMTRAAAAAAMHKDTGLAHRLTDVALALHAIGCDKKKPHSFCPSHPSNIFGTGAQFFVKKIFWDRSSVFCQKKPTQLLSLPSQHRCIQIHTRTHKTSLL